MTNCQVSISRRWVRWQDEKDTGVPAVLSGESFQRSPPLCIGKTRFNLSQTGLTLRELHTKSETVPGFSEGIPAAEWFALTVKHQHEAAVRLALDAKQLRCYSPTYSAMQRWSDRVKRVERPLFPGYVFCQFAGNARTRILCTPGVRTIVSFGKEMIPIPPEEIGKIERMLASPYMLEPWPFLQAGQRVRIAAGPLAGIAGIFERRENGGRLVVGIEILRRSVAVHFEAGDLVPLSG